MFFCLIVKINLIGLKKSWWIRIGCWIWWGRSVKKSFIFQFRNRDQCYFKLRFCFSIKAFLMSTNIFFWWKILGLFFLSSLKPAKFSNFFDLCLHWAFIAGGRNKDQLDLSHLKCIEKASWPGWLAHKIQQPIPELQFTFSS